MKKIPTVFERDWEGDRSRVTRDVHPGCEWVLEGEGVATRKYDGTCCMFDGTAWWARREVKSGQTVPPDFALADEDETTGKTIGWVPIDQSSFAKFATQAINEATLAPEAGTYELCGPKVQGNPEGFGSHLLIPHRDATRFTVERTYDGIEEFLSSTPVEGLVFHHPDGRMAKIKARDFGIKRGV